MFAFAFYQLFVSPAIPFQRWVIFETPCITFVVQSSLTSFFVSVRHCGSAVVTRTFFELWQVNGLATGYNRLEL